MKDINYVHSMSKVVSNHIRKEGCGVYIDILSLFWKE